MRNLSGVFGLILVATANCCVAATESSTVMIMTTVAGKQEATYADDGSLSVHYEYNDRGRGPNVDARIAVNTQGLPTQVAITGKNYLKAPVNEKYTWADGRATWENGSDDGTREQAAPAFYISINAAPEELTLLTRALLQQPSRTLPLLPAGAARIREVTKLKVRGKAGSRSITMYAIEGLDLTPTYIWLDESQRLFAQYSSWQTLIRNGYEDTIAALGERQETEERKFTAATAHALTTMLKRPLVITPVRVFDPVSLQVADDQTVVIDKGRIVAVGKSGTVQAPGGADTLDGRNLFLMPGLWDMHAHYGGGYEGVLNLAGGVTTIRDLANEPDALAAVIKDVEAGDAIGPRVVKAGLVDGRGPFSGPTKIFADDAAEAAKSVDYFAKAGYEQIKIYSSIKPELVPTIAKLAHERGMRVSGHVPSFMTAREFVEAGADEIQHINFIMLSLVADMSKTDTRTPARFILLAQNGAALDLSSKPVRDWVAFLAQRQVVVDPTLSVFENKFLEQPGHPGPSDTSWVSRMPPSWTRSITSGASGLPMTREQEPLYRDSFQRMVEMVGLLYRSSVPIVAGTDNIAGYELVRELELYVSAGIPPAEVLRIATRKGAEVMKRADTFGRIAPGYVSDLILVDGDPTLNISDLRRVRTVIRGDRRYESAELYQALGIKPAQ